MFSLKNFIKNGFLKAVGKMADYQIILNAAGWLEKGVLDENDLMEIQVTIDAQYVVEEPIEENDTIVEEVVDGEEPVEEPVVVEEA